MRMSEFTKTEQRILRVLADGEAHTAEELFGCLNDDCNGDVPNLKNNLKQVLFHLRKKMAPSGRMVVSEWNYRRAVYRHVRLLRPASSE